MLLVAAGQRPTAADVVRLSEASGDGFPPFAVSHRGDAGQGGLELLAQGLAFDLSGLTPASPASAPEIAHRYGLDPDFPDQPLAAIRLVPGAHLQGAESLLPVVRTLVAIGTGLATLPGVIGLVWTPARCAMSVALFRRSIADWLDGGAFPALGLTALVDGNDGGFHSEGLAFFTGQELRLEPLAGRGPRAAARIAVRLIDALVGTEPVSDPTRFNGPDGEALVVEPAGDPGWLRVRPAA